MLAEPVKPGQSIRAEGFRAGGGNLGILQMAAVACGQLCAAFASGPPGAVRPAHSWRERPPLERA